MKTLREQILEELEERRMTLLALSEELGANYHAVRDAVRRLEAEGWVRINGSAKNGHLTGRSAPLYDLCCKNKVAP